MIRGPMLKFNGTLDEGDGLTLQLYGGDFSLTVGIPYKKTEQLFMEWFKHISPMKRNQILLKHIGKELGEEPIEEEEQSMAIGVIQLALWEEHEQSKESPGNGARETSSTESTGKGSGSIQAAVEWGAEGVPKRCSD